MRRFRAGQPCVELTDNVGSNSLQAFVQKLHLQAIKHVKDYSDSEVQDIYRCPCDKDESLWQYEHIRQFTIELSAFAVFLGSVCDRSSCPQMKATDEWMYLCAAHKQPQECSAIDYIIHTLDGTAALLNSNKWFPVGSSTVPESSLKYFHSITRRLYRILSHAFFHHKESFDDFESQNHLCLRFVAFAKAYDLIPPKLLIIPHITRAHSDSQNDSKVFQSDNYPHENDQLQLQPDTTFEQE